MRHTWENIISIKFKADGIRWWWTAAERLRPEKHKGLSSCCIWRAPVLQMTAVEKDHEYYLTPNGLQNTEMRQWNIGLDWAEGLSCTRYYIGYCIYIWVSYLSRRGEVAVQSNLWVKASIIPPEPSSTEWAGTPTLALNLSTPRGQLASMGLGRVWR